MPYQVFKQPLLKLNRLIGHSSAKNHMSKPTIGNISELDSPRASRDLEKAQHKQFKILERDEVKRSIELKRESDEEASRAKDSPEIAAKYGTDKAGVQYDRSNDVALAKIASGEVGVGASVSFTARIHHIRRVSPRLGFILLRQQVDTLQGVIEYREGEVSEGFIRWAEHLTSEGFVRVTGTLQPPPKDPVKGATIHTVELRIDSMHLVVPVKEHLPIDVYNIDRVEEDEDSHEIGFAASNRVRMMNRLSFLRTPAAQSIFRINAAVSSIFRSTLEQQGFLEIHTPKLQPAATESGAEVFEVKYFGRKAFLAQSPQLAKQLAISADMGRVFEIGSVFRAEDSNTHRHLTEFVSMDLEMNIENHYHEAVDVIDNLLKNIFKGIYAKYRKELDIIKTHFPHEDLVWLDETPKLKFKDAIELLNASGWTDDRGEPASPYEDLSTRAEIRLGELIKEKYKTDFYFIDKFPTSARPFYTKLDKDDERFTNSFDIFVRGQEITSGSQRIHDPQELEQRMRKAGIEAGDMEEYMQGFEYGVLPHAGCGIGLERVVFLLLNLGDVRNASLFPRDPKSLPEKKESTHKLPHPEADLIRFQWRYEQGERDLELPPIEKLIPNYGDATNTSWLDDRYEVWRHQQTGAAVGFSEQSGYALIMGDPLCDVRQRPLVVAAFLRYLRKERNLRPIWLLVSAEMEEILGSKLGWRTFSCVAEERVSVMDAKKIEKKQRQAEEAGVRVHEVGLGEGVPQDVMDRCDARIVDWKANRKGTQVHITEVRPWVDMEHRRYLWAENKEGTICGLIVLHRLSPENGYQIKFALDFPGSPSGTIELLISKSIASFAKSGIKTVTFGAGATSEMLISSNLSGLRAKILAKTYKTLAAQLKLTKKTEFREKFGAEDDRVFICYPRLGLGVSGARTLVKFFEDET